MPDMASSGILQRNLIDTPFRRSQIPAVIIGAAGVVLSLEDGDATTRFHSRNCNFFCLAARGSRAAA
jgi:hypothetical protein